MQIVRKAKKKQFPKRFVFVSPNQKNTIIIPKRSKRKKNETETETGQNFRPKPYEKSQKVVIMRLNLKIFRGGGVN